MPNDQANGAITISFPGLSPAEASALARELETAFHAEGATPEQVHVARDNPEAQDFGATLLVAGGALGWKFLEGAAKGIGEGAGKTVFEALRSRLATFSVRRRVPIRIAAPDGRTLDLGVEFEPSATAVPTPVDLGTLGAVLLGASRFRHMADLDNPAFARSAAAMRGLLAAPGPLFQDTQTLDLFDQDHAPHELVDRIEAHIDAHPGMADLMIYYCGHGGFLGDRTYFLTLAGTRKGREASTGLSLRALRHDLEAKLANRRLYLILDCCFAGAAVREFMGPDMGRVMETAVHEALPPGGWVVLAAAASSLPAMAPASRDLTMFTGALAAVWGGAQRPLSFDEIAAETRRVIRGTYGANGVLPECHAPRQVGGDLRRVALFGGMAVVAPAASPWVTVPVVERPVSIAPRVEGPPPAPGSGFMARLFGRAPQVEVPRAIPPAPAEAQRVRPNPTVPPVPRTPQPGHVIQEGPGPEMVLIPAGSFQMGSPDTDREAYADEKPAHRVMIPRPFWLGKCPVTRGEYAVFAQKTNHSNTAGLRTDFSQDDRRPVVYVNHVDAEAYCAWLSRESGQTYRLASEAEWEYAARAGTTTARYWGAAAGSPGGHAHFGSEKGTMAVGSFQPNPFGLYDMLGNVWEWTADAWHDGYRGAPSDGSTWMEGGSMHRVLRGGSWSFDARLVRAACRITNDLPDCRKDLGFRCARVQV